GNKAALLAAVLDEATAGPDAPRSAGEFMQERAGASGGGIQGLSTLLADWIADVNERSTEIQTLIQQTAAVYPEVAALARERGERRRAGFVRAASVARTRGGLAAGTSDEQAAAALWSPGHPTVFRSVRAARNSFIATVSSGSVGTGVPSNATTGAASRVLETSHSASADCNDSAGASVKSVFSPRSRANSKMLAWVVPSRIARPVPGVIRVSPWRISTDDDGPSST